MTYVVRYNIESYTGTITVNAEDEECAIAKARRRIREQRLPHASYAESYSIERELEE